MFKIAFLFMRKFSKELDLSPLDPYLPYCETTYTPTLKPALYNRAVKERYALVQKKVEAYRTPFTVLDCGTRQGYYAYSLNAEYKAPSFMWEEPDKDIMPSESRLFDFNAHKYNSSSLFLYNKAIKAKDIMRWSSYTYFDVVLAFNLIELFDKRWHAILRALLKIGRDVIVELPEDGSFEAQDLRAYLQEKNAEKLGDVTEFSEKISTLYLMRTHDKECGTRKGSE